MERHRAEGNLTYKCWKNMLRSCFDENYKSYKSVGGNGIQPCKSWLHYNRFLNDMGDKPPHTILTRRDPLKKFDGKNCYWRYTDR